MKILIVSDTHGAHGNLDIAMEEEAPFDMMIHLGDVQDGQHYIEAVTDCPLHMVQGNNDFFADLPSDKEIKIGSHRAFLTHGHGYGVYMGEAGLIREAKRRQADIVMYGHTHIPTIREKEGILVLNPGSLRFPRQEGRLPSYIVMKVEKGRKIEAEIKYIKK